MSEHSICKIGVFVDGTHVRLNGGYGMRYDVLRDFADRDGAEILRLNAYLQFDRSRAEDDDGYRRGQQNFTDNLRDFGYKVTTKEVRRYENGDGELKAVKPNMDVDITVDMLTAAEGLDRIVLVSGDGDFVPAVRALQARGKRVEVIAFDNVSGDLRREADSFVSGFLVPDLLPFRDTPSDSTQWGHSGSRVRGICYAHTGRGFGFLRFMKEATPELWITNTRNPDSPYASAFLHDSELPDGIVSRGLPSRALVFEFDLEVSEENDQAWTARNVDLVQGR